MIREASREPAANAKAPARVEAALIAAALTEPQLSLVATATLALLMTEMVGSESAPLMLKLASAGPAARTSNWRLPEPGATTIPVIRIPLPVPTMARVERLMSRDEPLTSYTSSSEMPVLVLPRPVTWAV